jgi:hypothetical protein
VTVSALAAEAIVAGAVLTAWTSKIELGMTFMTHQATVFTDPLMAFCTNGMLRGLGMLLSGGIVTWAGTAATGEASAATALGKLEIVCTSPACEPVAVPAWATAAAWPASPAGLAVGDGGVIGVNVPALAEEAA